jgi:hypothetical protein
MGEDDDDDGQFVDELNELLDFDEEADNDVDQIAVQAAEGTSQGETTNQHPLQTYDPVLISHSTGLLEDIAFGGKYSVKQIDERKLPTIEEHLHERAQLQHQGKHTYK